MQFIPQRLKSKSKSSSVEREFHPTLNELETIVNLPQNEWLSKLQSLKWRGNERINIDQWKNILAKLKEPITALHTKNNDNDHETHSSPQISLIYAILNIYITLITHSSRHTMHNFDILSIDSLQQMIDLDDIRILMIVLDVWNVFWHRSGGTMQFEHQDLKKKIVGLCHNILHNEFTLQIPQRLQQITKMSTLSVPIHKSYRTEWTQFAQTIKIPTEYCKDSSDPIIKLLDFDDIDNENDLRIAINKELHALKQQISLPSEKEFVLKWRMYFAAHCNNLEARQKFIRLRIKALLVLSTFAQQYSSLLRDFLSDIDFAGLSLELTELVELTVIPMNHTLSPSSPSSVSLSPRNSYPHPSLSPQASPHVMDLSIPTDIRIAGLLCLKNFVFQAPIPFEQLRSIWEENSFVPATLRSIINDLDHDPESFSTLKFASQFLNFLHSTITRTLPQMVGIHQFLDWNSMVQQVLTLIANKNIRDCSVLKESATLLYVILAKHRKPQTFIQFKGLSLCFQLIERIMENDQHLTNKVAEEYQAMNCMATVHSPFTYHMIQQYSKQHLISKLLECSMQSVRLSRQPVQYLRDPLVAKIMRELIQKCYKRPTQTFTPSTQSFTAKDVMNDNKNNLDHKDENDKDDDDDDTTMDDKTTATDNKEDNDEDMVHNDNNNDKVRRFAAISESSTPPPPSKRQKNKTIEPQSVLPIVPTPTDDYGHEVYQITCKMISVCIQNGAGLGVGKIFHEYGVTLTFVTSLTKQGVPNRSQVFQIVVESLRAICLYQPALDMIMQSGVIECLIRCFANPNYSTQLAAEAAAMFAKKMEELLRHNRKLQPHGIKAIVRTLKQLRNKPYLELQEIDSSQINYSDDMFPIEDEKEMQLIRDPPKSKTDAKDIYPLFPTHPKIKKKMIYAEEPCFTGDNEAFWSAVTNIGKFLETSLKKFTQWDFVKNGGMDALVQLSYDPIMHAVASMRTKVIKEEKVNKNEEKKTDPKLKDVTTEISAKFGSDVVPQTNPKMTAAQKAVANSYPHIEDTQWPNLINKLLETFNVHTINDTFVKRFHYFTLNDVDGDLKTLKRRHQELADALKTGSRITCLFSILTRLMRRADIKIIHKSKFYLFMKCLSDIIPGILWYMSCSDTNSVHKQATKLRTEILGLLSNDERKNIEEKEKENEEEDDDDDVDMSKDKKMKAIPKIIQDEYDGVFINIRYYECQVVSLMNHFTKFFKNALRIYRRSQDGRQRNSLLMQNNQNVVEYMSHMLHILIAFRAPLLVKGKANEAVFDFWSITQFYEYVCHIIEAMAFTSHKTIVEGLIKSFIQYGGLRRIVNIFRYFVHCLNLTLDPLWNNQTNDDKAFILSLDTENESNPLNSIIHGATQLFVKHEHNEDIKIRFCTESLEQKKKKDEDKKEEDTSKYGMWGVTENLKSVVIQFYNFLYSLMKAGNVLDIHRDFRRYLAVELAALLKSPWIAQRKDAQHFRSTDFALMDKIVDSTNQYITICTSFDIQYPPPEKIEKVEQEEIKEEAEEAEKTEMDVDKEEDDKKEAKKEKTIDPARQNAIDQLLNIVPDDRDLVVYALDALHESAPNNVSVALEWIFTHQEEWNKRKEAEAQQEKDATMNDDDEIKFYFKSVAKKEFSDAVNDAFLYDDKEEKLLYLKSDKTVFDAPVYWQYFPLFSDIQTELIAPLIGFIEKIPTENEDKWTFRPMSRPDQVEKLLKRIALLIKSVHKSIGEMKMKCYGKRVMWEEQQQANYKELQKQKLTDLIDTQEMKKVAILSKQSAKKEQEERKQREALLAVEEEKAKQDQDDNTSESYDEDEELRLAMEMSMMEQSDDNNANETVDAQAAEEITEIVPVPLDDGVPERKGDKMKQDEKEAAPEEKEEEFETQYYDEEDVEETEDMKKLLIFPNPPIYELEPKALLMYSIKRLLSLFKTPRYPNNHAAAYCFAILQDAEPRTISMAQGSDLLQTVCGLIEDCGSNLEALKAKNVDKDLDEKTYAECKANIKKYQSLLTTYYIIITGFLNKKAIRRLKENLLEDINRTHPQLYKNVSQQIASLDNESSAKKDEKLKKDEGEEEEKEEDDDDDDDDDDTDLNLIIKEDDKDKKDINEKAEDDETNDVAMDANTEIKAKSKYELKKDEQTAKKLKSKLEEEAKKKEQDKQNKIEFEQLYSEIQAKCDNIQLESAHKEQLLSSCLTLLNLFTWKPYFNSSNHSVKPKYYLRFQCEPNLLNRILTILSSVTAEYKYAKMLLNNEGYKCILNCSTANSSAASSRTTGAMATSIIRHMFDEPSLLIDAMQRQIKLSFEHFRKIFTSKQKSASSPFANVSSSEGQAFTQLFDPFMPLNNFMTSFKTLAARNEASFYTAVKNTCLIQRDAKSNLVVSSRELLNKYALTLKQESKQNAKWESQDPRLVQWVSYTDGDNLRIESVYQAFVNQFVNEKFRNFHSIPSSVTIHFDGQPFTVDVREYRQKNASGGSRKIRRRRLTLEEKRKIALVAKKEKEEKKEKLEKEQKAKAATENKEKQTDANKKSEKEEADEDETAAVADEDGDVIISDNSNKNDKDADKRTPSRRTPSVSPTKANKTFSKHFICEPQLEQFQLDDKVLQSFVGPLNALMSIIITTTESIKEYCVQKRVEMKNDERERQIKKKKELEKEENTKKETESKQIEQDEDDDIDIKDKLNNSKISEEKTEEKTNEIDTQSLNLMDTDEVKTESPKKLKIDDDELEESLPSMAAMQTILGGSRLFATSDMLKILNEIIGNYPKFSGLVVNFNTPTSVGTTSFVQFMIEELIPYATPLNESKNVVKPDTSTIASNLLKSIAGLNLEKNELTDQSATKLVITTLVKHIATHSNKLYILSSYEELVKQPESAPNKWDPVLRMDKKLLKRHENAILAELYQVKSNLEVLREFVNTPSDRFCRFAARILTDSEVIDMVCRVLESKFDYGLSQADVANNRLSGSVIPHSVELKSNFLNPIAKLLHNICEIDCLNPIYNLLKSQRRKSRKRKSMDGNVIIGSTHDINTATTSPSLEPEPESALMSINDGIIRSTSDDAGPHSSNVIQFISNISAEMGGHMDDIQDVVIEFDVDSAINSHDVDDEDMVDSQDMNDESNINTEIHDEDDDDEEEDDEDDDDDEDENDDDNADEQDADEEDDEEEDEEDEDQYNDENLDRLYGQYAEDEDNDGFYDDEDLLDNEYDEYGEDEDDEDDDDDDDDNINVPSTVHRIANEFMDELGGASDDFRQFFIRSQRFTNMRRLDSLLNGDDGVNSSRAHGARGGQAQIHFVNQNRATAIPTIQPMVQMIQQHTALIQGPGAQDAANIVHYPPPPMNVHIAHDLQQRYRLHHANRHGLHRIGQDVPQSSSTLFQRAFGESPEARRPRSLMAIYRLIDRPTTSYFNSSDVQNELYNTSNTLATISRHVGSTQTARRNNANAQNDIMNHFSRIQRFYDPPHRRMGGANNNANGDQYRNEQQQLLAQNLMRDYVNDNWSQINQSQITTQSMTHLQAQFSELIPAEEEDENDNQAEQKENDRTQPEQVAEDNNVITDIVNPVIPEPPARTEAIHDAVDHAIDANVEHAPTVTNITTQVTDLLRGMPVNNNNNNNAPQSLDALTSQIFGMINNNDNNDNSNNDNNNNNVNNASLLEVLSAPATNEQKESNDNNDNNNAQTQSMDVDQQPNEEETQIESQLVEQKEDNNDTAPESQAPSTEQKQDTTTVTNTSVTNTATATATASMDVDNNTADASGDNNNNNNNNANADEDDSTQTVLTRLEREIENNPIWNYSEMLSFDPDVILSLPEIIRNDIIPPEFQNEVSTYLSMYQAQIAQRDIHQRRLEQEQQQSQAVPSDAVDNNENNENAEQNQEAKESIDDDIVMENDENANVDENADIEAAANVDANATEAVDTALAATDATEAKQEASESKHDATMDVEVNTENNADDTQNNDNDDSNNNNNNNNNNNGTDADAAFAAALAAELNQQAAPQTTPSLQQNNARIHAAAATTNANDNAANNNNNNNQQQRNTIDPNVLAALPPDIQQEILRDQQRNAVLQMTQNNEMDQATALLYYDPQTRMEMLMDTNDSNLAKLPSHLLAEAILLRNRRGGYGMGARYGFRRAARNRNHGFNDLNSGSQSQPASAWEIAASARDRTQTNNNKNEEEKDEKKEEIEKKEKEKENNKKTSPRKKRTPEENREIVIRKLCRETPASIRNRIAQQYRAPIDSSSLKLLLQIMETSEVGHSELVLRGIFARLCKYRRLRLIIFNSLFDELRFASPRYTSRQECAVNNNENRARLRRSLSLIRYLMQGAITAQYLVKYMQLPHDYEVFVSDGTPIKRLRCNEDVDGGDIDMNDDKFDISKCRILTLFSLFGSPMLKNQNILQSFVETLSMLCKSNEMYLTHLRIEIDEEDIKYLVSLISDHIRCNDSIFTKLNSIAKSIMNVATNKRSLTSLLIAESHNLSAQISKELDTIYKIIAPSRKSAKRLMKSWTITTKQNALLRNIEFLNKLISSSACRKFDVDECRKKISSANPDASSAEIDELIKEKEDLHSEQLTLLTKCSRGMEQLWQALDRCLEVFGYVPKDVLKKEIEIIAVQKEDEKQEKKEKEDESDQNTKKKENEQQLLLAKNSNSAHFFTNEEEAMKAKMNQQKKILKKTTNKEEDARITSSVERLSPLIRAFFILHDFYSRDEFFAEKTPEELHHKFIAQNALASSYLIERYKYFLQFTDKHRNIFNLLIAHKPKLLIGGGGRHENNYYPFNKKRSSATDNKYGAFAALIWHPARVLDFDNKKMFLRDELKKLKQSRLMEEIGASASAAHHHSFHPGRVRIAVRRKKLFADAFSQIKLWTTRELMSRLSVKFLGEDGVDAGGLTREFYQAMSHEMFNADYSLFLPTNDNKCVFQPNINSGYTNPSHLDDFKFVGLMCAKAIYDEQVLDAYFTRSFLKHVLGIKPNWHDLQSLDFQHYKNLKWMITNPINNVIFETFVANIDQFGRKKCIPLKANGGEIDVTDQNKQEYVKLIADFKMTTQIRKQIDAFKEGLHILIPHWLISIFTWPELDLLICGMPDIDITDMMNNTEYHGGLTKNTQIIKWFWSCVQEMDAEERALLLQFITGTSKVPIGGFKALPGMDGIQRLQIHASGQANGASDHLLPCAHTCFNQLDLPRYSSKIVLKKKLLLAIRECSQGFGFS